MLASETELNPVLRSRASAACRACGHPLTTTFCDLGATPLSNAMLRPERASEAEPYFPLHAWVCDHCLLVQLEQFNAPAEIFSDYTYFSSYSKTWLAHAKSYSEAIIEDLGLGADSFVLEVASNDGYLLKNFVVRRIPCLGIEPAHNVAEVARTAGVPTLAEFFGEALARKLASEGKAADLIVANNVLAHVPELNDFVAGLKILLKPEGVITIEVPHILNLIRDTQFDTIYHEHFCYFSLATLRGILQRHGLRIYDVQELPTHGGSLRIYACHQTSERVEAPGGQAVLRKEQNFGLGELSTYRKFQAKVRRVKLDLMRFFVDAATAGAHVACYGAAAKGNTLLNYCGIGKDLIDFAVDRSPHKQGLLLPGTRIPVYAPERVALEKPDYLLILPWNLKDEIVGEMQQIRAWGGRFVTAIPHLEIIE
jgi:SAM-dependent methyltransferase